MSEMKLIMESWRSYRLTEDTTNPLDLLLEGEDAKSELDNLKNDPQRAVTLMQQASKEKDKEKLARLARILMTDPEIKAAAEVISLIPAEVERIGEEAPDLTEIDVLNRIVGRGIIETDAVLKNPKVQKILPLGGITIMLGSILAALIPGADPQFAAAIFGAGAVAFKCSKGDGSECISSIVDTVATEASGVEGTMTGQTGQE